jgi:hypothetical protein
MYAHAVILLDVKMGSYESISCNLQFNVNTTGSTRSASFAFYKIKIIKYLPIDFVYITIQSIVISSNI